jgi:hypothetical protein
MLHWVGFALGATAAGIAIRWMIFRRSGSTAKFPWVSVVVLIVLGCLFVTPWIQRARLERRLSEAATQVSGRSVFVQCQSFAAAFFDPSANLGHVAFDANGVAEPRTLIKRDQCRDLSAYLASGKERPTREQIVAVHVLTHEAMHMAGTGAEWQAECLAVQNDRRMAELLGASPSAAARLAMTYWTDVYPQMPDEYRSTECKPFGGIAES